MNKNLNNRATNRGERHESDPQQADSENQEQEAFELHLRNQIWLRVGRRLTAERLVAVFSLGILAVTGFYTYYAKQQVEQTRASVRIAQDAVAMTERLSRLEQRAWVVATEAGFAKILTPGERPQVSVVFRNTGNSPANNVAITLAFIWNVREINCGPMPSFEPFVDNNSAGVMAPQSSPWLMVASAKEPSSPQFVAATRNLENHWYACTAARELDSALMIIRPRT